MERAAGCRRPIEVSQSRRLCAVVSGVAVVAGVLTGCGSRASPGGSPTGAGTSAAAPSRSSTTAPDDPMLTARPDRSRRVTATGLVSEGVEQGCLNMTIQGQYYQLIGEVAGLRPGAKATVTGYADPTVMTTCQSGIPFVVLSATAQ